MSARLSVRIPQSLKAKFEEQAAAEGKNISNWMRDHLPELIEQGLDIRFERPTRGTQGVILPAPAKDPLDRVAEKMEKILGIKMMHKLVSDIELSPSEKAALGARTQGLQPQAPTAPTFNTKDMMDRLTVWKMLESMEKKETNPEIQAMLKELKDAQVKALQTPKQPAKKEMTIEDLMKWMTFYRMAGQPEEAQKVQTMINQRLQEVTDTLHKTELKWAEERAEWRHQDLLRQISDIKNAPTELDQITRLSQLAEKDEAIRAYMNKKLGIKEKGEPLTPKKLKEYIESVKVPVGDILKWVGEQLQRARAAPPPPPPPTMPAEALSEAEIAERALPPELIEKPTPRVGPPPTFGAPPTEAPTPPEEAHLPPEEKETPPPPPPKKEKKPTKPKKGAKKK